MSGTNSERATLRAQGLKRCSKCQSVLALDAFPKSGKSQTGRQRRKSHCKKCETARNRQRNTIRRKQPKWREYHREYGRRWRAQNPGRQTQLSREWRASNPERARRIYQRWVDDNPGAKEAHAAVNAAVAAGRLVRPTVCERCGGGGKIEGHHADYDRPLDVEWLCSRCHRRHHAETG